MLPGYGGTAEQPLLVRFDRALSERGYRCVRLTLPRSKPSSGFESEVAFVKAHVGRKRHVILVGRSFGARVAVRYALKNPIEGLVLLGYPIRPPGKVRPDDEAALKALRVPALIVQGSVDELGPLSVLRRCLSQSTRLQILPGVGHSFAAQTPQALAEGIKAVESFSS